MTKPDVDVLLVEDNPADALLLSDVFTDLPGTSFTVTRAERLKDALALLATTRFDIVLLDLGLPDSQGVETFNRLHTQAKGVPIVVLTALDDEQVAIAALQEGADDYLVKRQIEPQLLGRSIRYAIERSRQQRILNAQLEQLVEQRTAELRAAMAELETFSYSVSHDLRAPLRQIDGFAHILTATSGHLLDETAAQCVQQIIDASTRMNQVIDALIELARLARAELTRQPVDLSQLAAAAAARLTAADPQREAKFSIENQIVADCDPALLEIVMDNLLGNAWKYTARTESATIEFGADSTAPGQRVFFVRDNGAGFSMDSAAKLFQPFQRLHSDREFPGTGIGLATVQRIIQRHNGQIWAQAIPSQGATFYFTLTAGADAAAAPAH